MKWYLKIMAQYVNLSGRARRTEYWMFVLFYSLILFAALILDNILGFDFKYEMMGQTVSEIMLGLFCSFSNKIIN